MICFSRRVQIALAALVLVALACTCSAPSILPTPNPRLQATVPVSQAAADRFAQKWAQAASGGAATGGKFDVTFTETELTSFVARQLDQMAQSGQQAPLTDPQVHLTGGQIWVSGQVSPSDSQHVNVQVALTPGVSGGQLTITVTKVSLGALPVPQSLVDQVNQQIAAQMDKVNQATRHITLTGVTIREGEMEITGAFK
jgi:hypothetical protein